MSNQSSNNLSASSPRELWLEVGVVLCLGFVPHMVNGIVGWEKEYQLTFAEDMFVLLAYSIQVIAVMLYIIWRSNDDWPTFGISKPDYLMDGVLSIILIALTLMLATWSYRTVDYYNRGIETVNEATYPLPKYAVDYVLLVVAMLFNSFAEELVMRAYLITRLRQLGANVALAVVVPSLLFASYHIYQGVPALIPIALGGLLYGVAFVLTKRLWPLIVAHTAWNIYVYL